MSSYFLFKVDVSGYISFESALQVPCKIFSVPPFQREYAWENKHVTSLIRDVEFGARMKSDVTHPFGQIVLRDPRRKEAGTFKTFEHRDVVDGQQRLTSIFLFLAAIRWRLKNLIKSNHGTASSQDFVDMISGLLFWKTDTAHGPRLVLQEFSMSSFRAVLDDTTDDLLKTQLQNGGNVHLVNAAIAFRREMSNKDLQTCSSYYSAILQRFHVVTFTVETDLDATVMFELINARGRGLTDLELLKNHVVARAYKLDVEASREYVDRIQRTWQRVLRIMWDSKFTVANENQVLQVLKALNTTVSDNKGDQFVEKVLKAGSGDHNYFDMVKDSYFPAEGASTDIGVFLNRVLAAVKAVAFIIHPQADVLGSVPESLRGVLAFSQCSVVSALSDAKLKQMEVMPLLASVFLCFKDPDAKDFRLASLLESALEVMERRITCLALLRPTSKKKKGRHNYRVRRLHQAAYDIATTPHEELARSKLHALLEDVWSELSEDEIKKASQQLDGTWEGCRHILVELERYTLYSKSDELPSLAEVTHILSHLSDVDHILPQTRHASWGHFEDYDNQVYQLGNLVLLNKSGNSKASNTRDGKIKALENSPLLSVKLADLSRKVKNWNEKAISERGTELKQFVSLYWSKQARPFSKIVQSLATQPVAKSAEPAAKKKKQ
jgi:hypothetical protein